MDSDPLPFPYLQRPELYQNVVFVDIDYPQLIEKKVKIVKETASFRNLLSGIEQPQPQNGQGTKFKSDQYIAIGCDLGDLATLDTLFSENNVAADCSLLFTAEVSLTYMEVDLADKLIEWASKFEDGM
jgi:tRNA wybutosine-synthesizing protein 4